MCAALVTSLAACGRIGFDDLDPAADSSIDGAPTPDDVDGDGVPNATDNCPDVSNSSQANEDGDRFGDACDPCPPVADGMPVADMDGDGVSDACDPRPATPGDSIAVFEGFAGSAMPPGWSSNCPWTFSGGSARIVSANGLDCYLAIGAAAAAGATVQTHVTVDGTFGTSFRSAGTLDMFDAAMVRGVQCQYVKDSSNANELEISDGSGPPIAATGLGMNIAMGLTGTPVSTRQGQMYTCASLGKMTSASTSWTTAAYGIRTLSLSAHFDWVLAIAH
jgi:hypothetical protein